MATANSYFVYLYKNTITTVDKQGLFKLSLLFIYNELTLSFIITFQNSAIVL